MARRRWLRGALGAAAAATGAAVLAACGRAAQAVPAPVSVSGAVKTAAPVPRLPVQGTPAWPVDVATAQPTAPWSMYAQQNGRFEMVTFGSDIWNKHDDCGFYYDTASGDGVWTCRVGRLSATKSWAKGGLMIRASTHSGSTNVDLVVTPGNGVVFQYRPVANQPQQNGAGQIDPLAAAPVYLKLQKQGNVYTAWDSPDGKSWGNKGIIAAKPDIVGASYLVGLCATSASYSGTKQGLAGFDHVTGFTPRTYAAIIDRHGDGHW